MNNCIQELIIRADILTANHAIYVQSSSVSVQSNQELDRYPLLKHIEDQTMIPKTYTTLGLGLVYFLLIFVNIGGVGQLLANFVTLIIPGYYSLVALEAHNTQDDTHYLTYWVVYAAFSVIEFWSKALLYWIPFYWLFKTVLFLYLGLPQYNGARWVYFNILRPFSVSVLDVNSAEVAGNLNEKVLEATVNAEGHSSSVEL